MKKIMNRIISGVVGVGAGTTAGVVVTKKTGNLKAGVAVGAGVGAGTGLVTSAVLTKVSPDTTQVQTIAEPAAQQPQQEAAQQSAPVDETEMARRAKLVKSICGSCTARAAESLDFQMLVYLSTAVTVYNNNVTAVPSARAKTEQLMLLEILKLWEENPQAAKVISAVAEGNRSLSNMSADDAHVMMELGYSVMPYTVKNQAVLYVTRPKQQPQQPQQGAGTSA